MSSEIDHSTLRWVKKELDETLREAAAALERFSEDPADTTQAQFCVAQLHQVRGILQMLELHGAAMLTEEMELLGGALLAGGAPRGESGAEVLMGAILRLRDYLERLEGGQQDAALLILPLVNELRATRGEAIIAESALFAPDLERTPDTPRHARDGTDRLPEVAGSARTLFQRGLLGFLRGQGTVQGLQRMREAADQLDAAAPDDRSGAFWWITGTLAEALAEGALGADAAVRNLIGQVDRQIKASAKAGAGAERPEALMRGLLYYLAGAEPATPRIEALQAHYGLPALIADQQRLEQAREGLFGPGADAFRSVAEAIREDLAGVKDTLDLYVRGSAREPERLGAAADAMRRIADTLGVLGLAAPRRVVLEQAEFVRGLEGGENDARTVMKAAESLLYVESALQGLGARAPEAAEGEGEAAAETPASTLFRSEYREVVALTLDEAITEVGRVKEAIVRFLESHDGGQLEGLDERFASIRGALGIMELPRPAALVGAAGRYVTEHLASDDVPPPAEALDDLADALTSIEYYLEALREGRGRPAQVLDVAENGLRRLGVAVPAAAPAADAELPAVDAAESIDGEAVAAVEPRAERDTVPEPDPAAQPPDAAIDFSRRRGRVDLEVPVRAEALDPEIVEIFVEEAGEVLETLAVSFPRWRGNPEDENALLTTRRMFHTLKGSGRLAGALLLGELAWAIENLLNRVLDRSRAGDDSVFDVAQRAIDVVPGLLEEFQGGAAPAADVRALMREAARLADPACLPEPEQAAGADGEDADAAAEADVVDTDVAGVEAVADAAAEPAPEGSDTTADDAEAGIEASGLEASGAEGPATGESAIEASATEEAPAGDAGEATPDAGETDAAGPADAPDREPAAEVERQGAPALPAMDPILYEIFSKEAEDHLAAVDAFLDRAGAGEGLRASDRLIRSLHTLTGSARMAEVEPIARLGRRLEDLARIRFADARPLSVAELDAVARSVARVREIVSALGRAGEAVPGVDSLVAEVDALKGSAPVPSLEAIADHDLVRDHDEIETEDAGARDSDGEVAGAEPADDAGTDELAGDAGDTGTARDTADGDVIAGEGRAGAGADAGELEAESPAGDAGAPAGWPAPPDVGPAHPAPEPPDDDDSELRAIFLEEAEELRGFVDELLADWADGSAGEAPAESLQRALHTLKGGARLAGQAGIARLCHATETLAAAVAEEGLAADDSFFRLAQRASDHLGELLASAAGDRVPGADEALVEALERAADAAADTGDAPPVDAAPGAAEAVPEDAEPPPDDELVEVFLEEATEIMAALEAHLNEWREGADEEPTLVALQRALHTLKGGARMAGFQPVADLAHALETLLRRVQEGAVTADPPLFELLETASDALVAQREAAEADRPVAAESALVARIEGMIAGAPPEADGRPDPEAEPPPADAPAERGTGPAPAADDGPRRAADVVRVRSELLDDLVNFAGEVSIYRARLEQQAGAIGFNLGELGQTVRRLRDQLRTLEIETETQILHRVEREHELQDRYGEDFDPLEMDRFSQIQELSRALSESVNDLSSIEGALDNLNRESETLLLQQSRVNAELQDGLMRTRMVPFANLAPRLRRIVRQASQELGREARLRILGAEGEMDRTVLERIVPPLEHMLRNSVAHGIEAPEVRRAAGKPEGGTISVSLAREGADVVIRVADDGGGMDLAAIRRKAVRQGLMHEDSALSDREVMQFVLASGFSTAEAVTQIAGRGVGMDVVNAEIRQLGGNLEIDSTPGEGTRFTVRLPFTLALNQALLCQAGDELYAIPLSSVEGVVRMTGEEVNRRLDDPEGGGYDYAGTHYTLRSLGAVLGAAEVPRPAPGSRVPLLLVQAGESRMALQVDGLVGSRDIVVKSPGPQIASVPGVLGATILADGRVVLILDVSALVRFGLLAQEPPRARAARRGERGAHRPLVMVVDDSITMRKVASRLLERNDIDVITAKDGVDAVAALKDRVPDTLLLDIEMPRMDGYEVAVHMRNDPHLRDVPIVMITSRTGEKHRQRALDIGVDRYIGKPYQEGDLLATVRELLEHGRAGA